MAYPTVYLTVTSSVSFAQPIVIFDTRPNNYVSLALSAPYNGGSTVLALTPGSNYGGIYKVLDLSNSSLPSLFLLDDLRCLMNIVFSPSKHRTSLSLVSLTNCTIPIP